MRRNGFTMVELIFVIIIIGILSVAAIPKFGDIKDRAKVSTEFAALGSLESVIEGKIEFAMQDNGDDNAKVLWHNEASTIASDADGYKTINESEKVLGSILKKGKDLKIVGFIDGNKAGKIKASEGDSKTTFDILMIEGPASNHTTGVKQKETAVDTTKGQPDKNDFWVFNPTPLDVTITSTGSASDGVASIVVPSGSLVLIDATGAVTVGNITAATATATNTNTFTAPSS